MRSLKNRCFFVLALAVFAAATATHSATRPNVLFIAIDDLRPDLGCYGHGGVISPNIDKLATEGVRFDHAYCQQSVCNPSRASVLTGLRPDSTQVHGNHTHYRDVHPDLVTLPQHFKNCGYHTQAFGKIYHGVFPAGASKTIADTFGDPESWSVPAFLPGPRYYYSEEGIELAKGAYLKMYRPKNPSPTDWTEKLVFGPVTEAPDVPDEILYDGMVAEAAVNTLRELSDDDRKPFFLAVGFIKPHTPFVAPKKYWDLYDPEEFELALNQTTPVGAPNLAMHGSGEIRRYTDQPGHGKIPDSNQRRMKHGYAACISYVDAQVGKVLAVLEDLELRDNTIVVLWSDHGYHLGEKDLWGKTTNFELDARVAMIVSAPDQLGNGQSTEALVELVDLYPTLVDLVGLPAPNHVLQGSSFVPVLDDPSLSWKRAAFSQFTRGDSLGYSLTDGRHRYTEWFDLNSGKVKARELYDQKADSEEMRNLANEASHSDTVRRLSRLLGRGEGWRFAKKPVLQLAKGFGDHMVLQRDKPIPVWGDAKPGAEVTVAFAGQKHSTISDVDGTWNLTLDSLAASGLGRELVVTANDQVFKIGDVLVGEVWLCAGQSNMRWMLKQSQGAKQAIAASENPKIRLLDFTGELYPTKKRYSLDFLRSVGADNYYQSLDWQRCEPDSVATFSAVAYYFGALLQGKLGVPVGLIHNAIGGVPMESYIPTSDSAGWLEDAEFPGWCRERARDNLAAWLEQPSALMPHHPFEPGFLYEAGMRPLEGMALRGFLWYQGESNATSFGAQSPALDPTVNKAKFLSMIDGWREAWGNHALPFYFVQLPGLNRDWSLFREMQLQVSREVPYTGMAVTIDVGHPTNVHPTNKRPVGERLARLALEKTYGEDIEGTSPFSKRAVPTGDSIELTFSANLTTSDGKSPEGFVVAGDDRMFHPAIARIEGRKVLVSSGAVASPVAARYAWKNDPEVNLTGRSGLPVSPFRTDEWRTLIGEPSNEPLESDAFYSTSFESVKAVPFESLQIGNGTWTADAGHAQITSRFAHRGRQSLHLRGGSERAVTLRFDEPVGAGVALAFQAERWTSRSPYTFRVEAEYEGRWQEIYNGDQKIKVGRPFLSAVQCMIPEQTSALRFMNMTPTNAGTLIDDLAIRMPTSMKVDTVFVTQAVIPVLIGKRDNPVIDFSISTTGSLKPKTLRQVTLNLSGTTDPSSIEKIRVYCGTALFGEASPKHDALRISGEQVLGEGENLFRISVELKPGADQDHFVNAGLISVGMDEATHRPTKLSLTGPQRIGVAVRTAGQDDCNTYRIPGLATTNTGTLIAVYDNRYRSGGDLPGDIDVGMSRSTDGGRTWEPMKVVMDMGDDPAWSYDGIGDPSVLVDRRTGRIWITATWSHGDRSWNGSGPGLEPEETGQFLLTHSDDDGISWSRPVNITKQIKKPEWRFVLQGPGKGISMRDGTLVFPAQFRGENAAPIEGKPFSTLIYSKDRGETWEIGTGVKIDTTEAQLVELGDGSIMINCRDNRNRGLPDGQNGRTVAVTNDLGETWEMHPTDRKALAEPTCMASLIRIEHEKYGALLVFSNPATGQGRFNMTLKVSNDEGMTWPKRWHTLYDARQGAGYSCLTRIDEEHVGVLYEGVRELYFVRFSIAELLNETR